MTALKQAGFFVRTVIVPGAPHFWIGGSYRRADQLYGIFGTTAPTLLAESALIMGEHCEALQGWKHKKQGKMRMHQPSKPSRQ